ncbi:alpha/beta fold hydrolase [Kribbella sandramycini]|uniref:Alpha/beta fold hydrolase n=1 Tax=Kribbella sandramycini TaxID=60450 RepID=A0A7Y4KVZ7_9ACTN|nr:alpha/beta hydrolase [Kribbella sandramycini]MBB6568551.1 pimeloyl-ACP methyl ester carboxylesterase [Kribbella sandramycini]NOL38861.1 alpha/beta fold hydrolase [Kribbella sandramycini]
MPKKVLRAATIGVLVASLAAQLTVPAAAAPSKLKWGACPPESAALPQVGCATLKVPLDYSKPNGRQITLTISGVGSLAAKHALMVNPGGPGAPGIGTEQMVRVGLSQELYDQYAVFSFDPRGVGASTPVSCGDTSKLVKHPALPCTPANAQQEAQRVQLAQRIAAQCGKYGKDLLPYITTENAARDLDRIRIALGRDKLDYLGYSYGTKLGATYATLFPQHTGRMVLNSVVDPLVSTYRTGFEQNPAFEARADDLFQWIAARDKEYHLGKTATAVEALWDKLHRDLAKKPAGGRAGAAELEDVLASSLYTDDLWSSLADAIVQYRQGDPSGLLTITDQFALQSVDPGLLAYNCIDPGWPRNWRTWHWDTSVSNRRAPHFAWSNTWFSAPCAFWPVTPKPSVRIGSTKVPPILLIQGRRDPATPVIGARRMQAVLHGSRLLLEDGGNHASYLQQQNPCIDQSAEKYLLTGRVPTGNVSCPAGGS